MSRPFWWTRECEAQTSPEDEQAEPELADEEADRLADDMLKGW